MNETVYSKYRWVVIAALCGIQAMTVAVLVAPATLVGEMSSSMGLSSGETIAVTMVFREIFVMLSAFAGGALIDRFGPYMVWTAGAALLILGSFLVPVCGNSLYGMLTIRAMHGMGAGPIMATAPLVVAQWSPLHQRGIIIGIQSTFVALGAAFSMIFVPVVFEHTGSWHMALTSIGALTVVALIMSFSILLGPKPPKANDREALPDDIVPSSLELKKALALYSTWAGMSCSFCFGWVVRIIFDIFPSYLTTRRPMGLEMGQLDAGKIMSGVHLLSIAAALLSGFLLEKCFRGRPRGLLIIGFILASALWLLFLFSDVFSHGLMLPLCIWVGGFGISLTCPLVQAFVSKSYPKQIMGKISGLITGFGSFGTLSGLAIGSWTLHVTGMYRSVILLVGIGSLLGFLSAFFLKNTHNGPKLNVSGTS